MSSNSKRPCEEVFASCKTLLFDVEGTTTSITFVKDTLFPYVRSNLETYVKKQWSSEQFKTDLKLLREQAVKDVAEKVEGCVAIPDEGSDADLQAAVIANVFWQMDGDRKTKALKQLQGHVMREGYELGELKGHLYSDVAPAMREWVEKGLKLYIYSSGSVEAQKLLFEHSEQGNLLQMFQGHFDTEVGSKQDVASYTSISKQVACSPSEVVFFTDIPAEAMAAEGAGMTAVLVVREENAPLSKDDRVLYQVIDSFDGFLRESPLKRRKVSDDAEVSSTDVEMTDVSEASTPVTPKANTPDKPLEKEATTMQATNIVETDNIENKIEVDTDALVTEDKTEECKPPTMDEPQTLSEKKESPAKDIKESTCNGLEMAETENLKPEEDKIKEVTEAKHTSKDQNTSDPVETEINQLLTPVENAEPTKLSTTIVEEAPTETKSKELEAAAEKTSYDDQKVGEPQIVVSKVETQEAPLEEKAIPEKTVIEEDKVTKMVMDAVGVQLETSQANDIEEVKKDKADEEKVDVMEVKEVVEEKVDVMEVKEVVEEKEARSPIGETKDNGELIEESVPQPMDAVVLKDTERIDKGVTVEVGNELEPNSSTDESGSVEKINASGKEDTLKKIENADTMVEGEQCLEKTDIAEINVGISVSEKIDTNIECGLSEKVGTIDTNVDEVAEKVDTIDEAVSEKEIHSMKTKVETDVTEKKDILDTKTGNDNEEADKLNGVVEMGQGDGGTLVELSKNVENGKDSIQVEEIKVKKVLADNACDDTENAVPVTMET